MSEDSDNLQFDRAEFTDSGSPVHSCSSCDQAIGGTYFEANGSVVCDTCRSALAAAMTGGSRFVRLVRAVFLGTLAGVLGAGIYFAILKITGWEIGLIAIVVGLLVGGAVHRGSGGRGGWLYQLMAMFITYCAIVATYVPLVWDGYEAEIDRYDAAAAEVDLADGPNILVTRDGTVHVEGRPVAPEELGAELDSLQAAGRAISCCCEDSEDDTCLEAWYGVMDEIDNREIIVVGSVGEDCDVQMDAYEPVPSWGEMDAAGRALALFVMFVIAIAVPFLTLPENIIGVAIIAFALHQAWRMNKRTQVTITGPYSIAPPLAEPTPDVDEPGEH